MRWRVSWSVKVRSKLDEAWTRCDGVCIMGDWMVEMCLKGFVAWDRAGKDGDG